MTAMKPRGRRSAAPQDVQKRLVEAAEHIPGVAEAMEAYGKTAIKSASPRQTKLLSRYATGANDAE